ncbi:histidine kinase (plasmid) [Halobiforma lacisalsi AJ5]|uniref:histidine kinase n=2 Tax=Natronobacterium lacisalsi TaxID=229731 RepID=M0LZ16_NATLA|nr:histidine kinase [Halobiforma lacisalsi AJ5]EMA37365.1 PAS/PAC sensor signal transduction histidine kinase [Halobiforma lacisalsi AJ5]
MLPPFLDSLETGISIHDPETGTILDVNDQFEEIFGYSLTALREQPMATFTAPSMQMTSEEVHQHVRSAATGEPQSFELQIERPNGEYRWVDIQLTQTAISSEKYVLGQVSDVTEYKVREQLLRLLHRVLRHNLRNDMNILIGYADRVKTSVESEQLEDQIETILDIASEVGALSDSLDQIEQIVQSDATEREAINLHRMVTNRVQEFQSAHSSVTFTVEGASDVWVTADSGLQYAIDNAIENAIVHNDQETPEVAVTVTEDTETDQGVVRIADNGPSIPDIEIEVLQDNTDIHSTFHGSGIGLWLMKWSVDSLGGELSFGANDPRGNVVEIAIPNTKQ